MDTCKRMWSENQIGEIAKKNAAPAKLYAHNISLISKNLSQLDITFLFTIYLHTDISITSLSQIFSLYELYGYIPASGYIVDKADGNIKKGIAISYYVSEQMLNFYDISNGTVFAYYDTSKIDVSDMVIEV